MQFGPEWLKALLEFKPAQVFTLFAVSVVATVALPVLAKLAGMALPPVLLFTLYSITLILFTYWVVSGLVALAGKGASHVGDSLAEAKQRREKPSYYVRHGARWEIDGSMVSPTPICAHCLIAMRHDPAHHPPREVWVCLDCGHRIDWTSLNQPTLREDVIEHLRRDMRQNEKRNFVFDSD